MAYLTLITTIINRKSVQFLRVTRNHRLEIRKAASSLVPRLTFGEQEKTLTRKEERAIFERIAQRQIVITNFHNGYGITIS